MEILDDPDRLWLIEGIGRGCCWGHRCGQLAQGCQVSVPAVGGSTDPGKLTRLPTFPCRCWWSASPRATNSAGHTVRVFASLTSSTPGQRGGISQRFG